jgi:zinc protease
MTMNTQRAFFARLIRNGSLAAGVAAMLFAAAATTNAQDAKSIPLSQVERKNRAPVSKEILRVKLPKPAEATLPNGLTVLILEDHRLPTVAVQLLITGAGAIYEPADRPGLASVTAQMMMQGTASRTSRQIAEESERLGANVSTSSPFGSSSAGIQASGLSDNFEQWFALATDVLLHASFPPDELAKLKQRSKASLKQQRTQPGFLATERFSRAVYGAFPASVTSTTDASLDAMTAEELTRWQRERYVPQNAILAIAGDVKAATLIPQLQKWLAGWQKTDAGEPKNASTSPVAAKKIYLVDRPDSVQTTIVMGNIAIDRRDPDYPAMVVLNQIFGAGPQSRLFLNLRENKGYTYGVYSGFTALRYAGPWRAGGDVRTAVTDGAMTEFLNELNRIRDQKVADADLDDAKHSVVASFALSLENSAQLLNYATIAKLYGFPADYWDTYPAKIMAITADDVQRVAKKYMSPDTMQIVAVGDASKIKTVMEKYGPVEMYGVDGKPQTAATAPSGMQ